MNNSYFNTFIGCQQNKDVLHQQENGTWCRFKVIRFVSEFDRSNNHNETNKFNNSKKNDREFSDQEKESHIKKLKFK